MFSKKKVFKNFFLAISKKKGLPKKVFSGNQQNFNNSKNLMYKILTIQNSKNTLTIQKITLVMKNYPEERSASVIFLFSFVVLCIQYEHFQVCSLFHTKPTKRKLAMKVTYRKSNITFENTLASLVLKTWHVHFTLSGGHRLKIMDNDFPYCGLVSMSVHLFLWTRTKIYKY